MVGKINYVNQGKGQSFQGIALQCAACSFGQMAYVNSKGTGNTIQFDELDVYDNGEIEEPAFISPPTALTAKGTWTGGNGAGVGAEWAHNFVKSGDGSTATHWIWNYNAVDGATNWEADKYIVGWLEKQNDGLWYGFTDVIDLVSAVTGGAAKLMACSATAALLLFAF